MDSTAQLLQPQARETRPEVRHPRSSIRYLLPQVFLIPIVAGAIVAFSLMQMALVLRLLLDSAVVIAAILILGGLYWWGGKRT